MALTRPRWAHVRRDGEPRRRVVATVLAVLGVVVALVAVLLHAIPTTWTPSVVLAAGAHYPMWAAPVAVLLALYARRWATIIVAVVLTALAAVVQVPAWTSTDAPARAREVRIVQANLRLGQADPTAIVEIVRDAKADLLTTEELTQPEADRLVRAGLTRLLPYRYLVTSTAGTGNGIGIWSRYPLRNQMRPPGFDLKVIGADLTLPGGRTLAVVAAHVLPPFPNPPGDPGEWAAELRRLRTVLRAEPAGRPVLVAGDFNATVDHAQYRELLTRGYADGEDQAGAGYLDTYPADRTLGPYIAIDHVLTRGAVTTDVHTVELPGSDHRGLSAVVAVPSG